MNARWREIAGDMLEPKLKDIYFQETSTWCKGHNNKIWFQTKDNDMTELDRIWYVEKKSRNKKTKTKQNKTKQNKVGDIVSIIRNSVYAGWVLKTLIQV